MDVDHMWELHDEMEKDGRGQGENVSESTETTLLPCPFCGSGNIVANQIAKNHWFAGCKDCRIGTRANFKAKDKAIAHWNKRQW